MRERGRISAYSVNKKHISIKIDLVSITSMDALEELQGCKGMVKTIRIDNLQLIGKINSINLSNTTGFLVHAGKYEFINRSLFTIMDKDVIDICVSDKVEDKILLFLDRAAHITSKKRADLLYEITSFKSVKGKKTVFHLSDEQKKVVLDKLNKIIQSNNINKQTAAADI